MRHLDAIKGHKVFHYEPIFLAHQLIPHSISALTTSTCFILVLNVIIYLHYSLDIWPGRGFAKAGK